MSFQGHNVWQWKRVNFEVRKYRHDSNLFLLTPNSVMPKFHEFMFVMSTNPSKSSCSCQT